MCCLFIFCCCSCCVYILFFFFFFFKQKTAYEMRISDWSSDVCSSDLVSLPHREEDRHRPLPARFPPWRRIPAIPEYPASAGSPTAPGAERLMAVVDQPIPRRCAGLRGCGSRPVAPPAEACRAVSPPAWPGTAGDSSSAGRETPAGFL